jgi:hypothetical protein
MLPRIFIHANILMLTLPSFTQPIGIWGNALGKCGESFEVVGIERGFDGVFALSGRHLSNAPAYCRMT